MTGCFSLSQSDCKRVAALCKLIPVPDVGSSLENLRIEIEDERTLFIGSDGKRLAVVICQEDQGELPLDPQPSGPLALCIPSVALKLLRAFLGTVAKDGICDVTADTDTGVIVWKHREERLSVQCAAGDWFTWRKAIPMISDELARVRADELDAGALFVDVVVTLLTNEEYVAVGGGEPGAKERRTSVTLQDAKTLFHIAPFVWPEHADAPNLGTEPPRLAPLDMGAVLGTVAAAVNAGALDSPGCTVTATAPGVEGRAADPAVVKKIKAAARKAGVAEVTT